MRIAIIGGGAAGLLTAYLLEPARQVRSVTLFEKQASLGGHAHSVTLERGGERAVVDAAFEFFSERMFPTLHRLLSVLDVPVRQYKMTTTFCSKVGSSETVLLTSPRDASFVWDVLDRRKRAAMVALMRVLQRAEPLMLARDTTTTIEEYFDSLRLDAALRDDFIYPFFLAQWCVEPELFRTFVAYNVLRYAYLHRSRGFSGVPWSEVVGGTRRYIDALGAALRRTTLRCNTAVEGITSDGVAYTLRLADGTSAEFDHLVVATDARSASRLVSELPEGESLARILGQVSLFETVIALHGDARWMPENRKHWSVVNTRYDGRYSHNTVYKPWLATQPIFKSWVTYSRELPEPLYARASYQHAHIDRAYFRAQRELDALQGERGLWFAGAYTNDVDCHESALRSSLFVAKRLAGPSARLTELEG